MSRPATSANSALTRLALGLAAATVAWVVVLAQLATTLHFALISHEICAVHGELLHGAQVPSEHPRHSTGTALLPGGAASEHDHCPLLGRRHDHVALVAPPSVELAPSVPALAPNGGEGERVELSRALILLTAPKQSPPA